MNVIGLDIGHSAVKVAAGGEHIIFPTAAAPAVNLAINADEARADTAMVNGKSYFIGQTALIHTNGALLEGLRDDWITTEEHLALMVAGWQRGLSAIADTDAILVLGLPSRLHLTQKKDLADLAVKHLGIDKNNIRVIPQALGAYMASVLDERGEPVEGRDVTHEKWGVIDVGYYTADYGIVQAGVWAAAGARSSGGANLIATDLRDRISGDHGVGLSLREADKVLQTRSAKLYGQVKKLDEMVDEACSNYAKGIMDHAIRVFGDQLPTLDGILLAGGAAEVIHPHLKKAWPHSRTAPTPRFTVAEGMRRYGLLTSQTTAA